jgi:ABC-type sugar transport system substrate-binding protein
MKSHRKLAAALMCGALVIAACGGDEEDTGAATATEAEPTASAEEPTASAEEPTASAEEPTASAEEPTASAEEPTASAEEPTASAGGDDPLAAAQANVDSATDREPAIAPTIPLTGVPEKKTFGWLECDVPTCAAYITPGITAAVEALGWDLEIIPMKSTDPGPAVQQAIDAGVDYIASTGLATAQYQPQLEAAKAAGIEVMSCFGTDDPSPEGLAMQCGDENFVLRTGPLMADWMVVDSGGAANVLIVSIPDFPVLKVQTDAFIEQLGTNCPDCTYEELNVTLDDLIGGRVPASVVSKVQANSDLNYIFYSFGDLPGGITPALQTAGLFDQVKQFGQDFSAIDLQEIVDGTMGAWSADPKGYAGWLMVDAAARLSLGMTLDEERNNSSLLTVIVDDPAFAQQLLDESGGDWFVPAWADQFKALWGV